MFFSCLGRGVLCLFCYSRVGFWENFYFINGGRRFSNIYFFSIFRLSEEIVMEKIVKRRLFGLKRVKKKLG